MKEKEMTSKVDYDNSLLDKADILTDKEKIPVIPIVRGGEYNKHPALPKWTDRRDAVPMQLASQEERISWFKNDKHNLAIILDKQYFGIDLDGPESKRMLWHVLVPKQEGDSTRRKMSSTWHVMTPGGGEHLVFRTSTDKDDKEQRKISSKTYGVISNIDNTWKHDLLELVAHPKYMIMGSYESTDRRYKDVTDMRIETLYKEELDIFLELLRRFKVLVDTTCNIAKSLSEFYHNNHRNTICWTLAGYLFKYGCPEWIVCEIIRRVAMYN